MFLDNWYNLLLAYNQAQTKTTAVAAVKDYAGADIGGTPVVSYLSSSQYGILQLFYSDTGQSVPSIWFLSNGTKIFCGNTSITDATRGIILGDGNTQPALDDYCLSGNIITDFTASTSVVSSYQNGKITGTATYNITNTGGTAFTIKEIGNTIARVVSGVTHQILIARALLATPVTIQPGDTGVVTYKIEIS